MASQSQILMILASLLSMVSYSTAFWFASEEPVKATNPRALYQQPAAVDYYRQYMPPPFSYPIPVQVPVQGQYAPAAVQNVQLVPCLCPVSQEYSYDNSYEYGARKGQYGHSQGQPSGQQQRRK